MESILGGSALSAFKSSKLLQTLKGLNFSVCSLSSQYIHFLDCNPDSLAAQSELLSSLLSMEKAMQVQKLPKITRRF